MLTPQRKIEIDTIVEERVQKEIENDEYPVGRDSTPTRMTLQVAFVKGSINPQENSDLIKIVTETGISIDELREYCEMRYKYLLDEVEAHPDQ